jgi:septal ring factor EnvC (AmiA/AmiB activator)
MAKKPKRDQSFLDWLGGGILHRIDRKLDLLIVMEKTIMADLTGINEAIAAQSAALDSLSTEITQLADQVAALTAGSVTQEELDAIAASLNTVATGISDSAAAVDAIVTDDDTTPEPTPEP